jgi:hypothetical protein
MDYLFIERGVDENIEPMLYAEYWGYDDKQTPEDETDDEHLYFIRWYVLKDSLNTNAHSGQILLFNPDLTPLYSWDITALRCLEHGEATDGLRADSTGIKHGVIVPVPVSVMQLGGEYRFLLQTKDEHLAFDKAHRHMRAIEINAQLRRKALILLLDADVPNDIITEQDFREILARVGHTFGRGYQFATGLGIRTIGAIWDLTDPESALGAHQLSDFQKREVRRLANSGRDAADPFVVTIGKIEGPYALYAYYSPGSGNGTPDKPVAVKVLLNNVSAKVQDGEWDKRQALWAIANSIIHELTHALSRGNNHHAVSSPRCVYEMSFANHFLSPICNNVTWGPPNKRQSGVLPWHQSKEVDAILSSWDGGEDEEMGTSKHLRAAALCAVLWR